MGQAFLREYVSDWEPCPDSALDHQSLSERVADLEARLQSALTQAAQIESLRKLGSWEVDLDAGALRWSDGTYRIFKLPCNAPVTVERALGFYPEEARQQIAAALEAAMLSETSYDVTVPFVDAEGKSGWARTLGRPTSDGGRRLIVGVIEDVSAEKTAQDEIRDLAYRDALTGLPNRRAFQASLTKLTGEARSLSLLLIDLDNFKAVNDTHGHPGGDTLLREVAARLAACAGTGDMVARLGGDEFGIILPGLDDADLLQRKGEAILHAVRRPVRIKDTMVCSSASIGIARTGEDTVGAEALLLHADLALYRAKARGRDCAQLYDEQLGREVRHQASVVEAMRYAIAKNELTVHYQPIVDLRTRAVRGLEALVRWDHPERGLLSPAAFEAALRDPVLSVAIDDVVLRQALRQMRIWMDGGLSVAAVNVNASLGQLRRADLVETVAALLEEHRLEPKHLKFEVVETSFLGRDTERVATTIARLAELGVVCALDDFGTGFSSLSHLKQFRVGRIKIDRSFVANICSNDFDRGLVRSLTDLGRNLGIRVTAEGVETEEQIALLREFGCDCAQGYLIGRPSPASEIPRIVAEWLGEPERRSSPVPPVAIDFAPRAVL